MSEGVSRERSARGPGLGFGGSFPFRVVSTFCRLVPTLFCPCFCLCPHNFGHFISEVSPGISNVMQVMLIASINLESTIPLHHPLPSVHSESHFYPLYTFTHTPASQCQRLGTLEINPTYLKLPQYKHDEAKRLTMFQSQIHYHYPALLHILAIEKVDMVH